MNQRLWIAGVICAVGVFLSCLNPSSPDRDGNNVVIADKYEPDNSDSDANSIKVDSAAQVRTLKRGDDDWVYFSAISGNSYRIFTTGKTDTRISVYSNSGSLIAEGDDSPGNNNASVILNCTSAGKYYACISGNDEATSGSYDLSIVSTIGPDSYEPDLEPSDAYSISTSSYQSRTMEAGDVDWVKFTISSADIGDTVLVTAAGTCKVVMTLYDRDTVKQLISSTSGDSVAQVKRRISTSGTYFIKIVGQNSSSSGSYKLTMQSSGSGTLIGADTYESDNTLSTAKPISGSSTTQQRSFTVGDTDWVKLPVEAGRQYNITFTCINTVYAVMYSKDGTVLKSQSTSLSLNSSDADSVYIKIYSYNSTPVSYTLNLTVLLQPSVVDQYEKDNTPSKAKFFNSDSLLQDRTLTVTNSVSDTDWVAFPVYAGKKYTFTATSSSANIYMYLYRDTSSSYLNYDSDYSPYFTYTPTFSDTVYLMTRLSGTTATAYTLSVSGVFINDSYEPDSSRSTAKTLETSMQSHILLPGDTDWVIYTATPGDSFAILTTGTTDTKLALFTSSGTTPAKENDDISSDNFNAEVSLKSEYGGQFYVRVTGKTSSTTGSYTLQALSTSAGTLIASDTFEYDDTKSSARFIKDTMSRTEVHSLTMGDSDWIAIPIQSGVACTVSVSNASDYVSLYCYSSNGSFVNSRTDFKSGSISYTASKDDTLYFQVNSYYSDAVEQYTLFVKRGAPPSPDQYEEDDTKSSARIIKDTVLNAEVHSLTAGDTDWIALPVLAGGVYTFSASSSSNSMSMYCYTSKDSLIASRSSYTSPSVSYTALANDTIYFRIFSSYIISRYTLSMSRVAPPAPDTYEPDNSKSGAYKATGSFSQSRTITARDTDWVSIPVVAGGKYTLSSSTTYVQMALFNQGGVQLNGATTGSLIFTASAADTFYYQMTASSPNSTPTAKYTLTMSVSLPVSADSYENDNTMSSAKPISTDSTVQDRTITPGDTDFVSFSGNAGDRVTIRVAHSTSNYTYLYIYDSTGTLMSSYATSSGGISYPFSLSKAGLFYARITSQTTQNFSYNLSAKLRKIDTLIVGSSSARSLSAGDTQWVAVALDSGKTYSIQTTGSSSMRLYLYDSLKASTYINYSSGTNPVLSYKATRTGVFIIRASFSSSSTSGSFTLSAADMGVVAPVVGTWNVDYSWDESSVSGNADFVLNSDGTFTVQSSNGTWTFVGNTLTLTYTTGTVYTGTVTGQTVTGTMTSGSDSLTGTWTGTKL